VSDHPLALAIRLRGLLNAAHRFCGADVELMSDVMADLQRAALRDDAEIHQLSPTGVLAYFNGYVMAAWPPYEMRAASREAYRVMEHLLEAHGETLHMVHPLNFPSVKLTRKMGAEPIGVDKDGFVHYRLTREAFHQRVKRPLLAH
jgi:hypothetical protein